MFVNLALKYFDNIKVNFFYEIRLDNTLTLTNVNKHRNVLNLSTFKNIEIINIDEC